VSYIAAIEIAVPEYCHARDTISAFFQNSTEDEKIKRKIKAVSNKSGIETRYSVINDYSASPDDFTFFPKTKTLEPAPNLSSRMSLFKQHATALSIKAIQKIKHFESIKDSLTHIITVTCTGLFAPGLDIEIVRELNLNPSIQRSSLNFMGCNAAILALNSANAICKSNTNAKVLIVCTELCTIHFQKNYSDDYILSTALFGDGCGVILVESQAPPLPYYQNLKILGFNSFLIHKGYNDMAWQLSETGFIMNLSSYVSGIINENIKQLLGNASIDIQSIDLWAIHPGGKRILDDFATALNLKQDDLHDSYEILKNYGNMSSATVLFVLKQLIETNTLSKKNKNIFAAAFGPGLSIETMRVQYV
jgi:predicted naringenin-chalcone synthase